MSKSRAVWLTAAFAGMVVAANWMTATFGLVPIGLGLAVTAGTFAAGGVLIVRDALQIAASRWWIIAAIAIGVLLSVVMSAPSIALASGLAFAASELVDWGVFSRLRHRSLALAVAVSSLVAAPVDTVLFLAVAGFGVTPQAVLGQLIVKTGMALVVAAFLQFRHTRRSP